MRDRNLAQGIHIRKSLVEEEIILHPMVLFVEHSASKSQKASLFKLRERTSSGLIEFLSVLASVCWDCGAVPRFVCHEDLIWDFGCVNIKKKEALRLTEN